MWLGRRDNKNGCSVNNTPDTADPETASVWVTEQVGRCSARHSRHPVNVMHWPDVGPMLGQCRRRRAKIGQTSGQCLMFAGCRVNIISKVRARLLTLFCETQ